MTTFCNQATLSYNGNTTNSNIVTGELVETLSATKTAVSDTYNVGDVVTYLVSIVNSGMRAFTNLTLTDNLGEYTVDSTTVTPLEYVDGSVKYYINGVLQDEPEVTAGPPLVIRGIDVPAEGNALVVYAARINDFAPLEPGGEIVNRATIDGCQLSCPIVVEETITVAEEAVLTISKAICPETVTENGEVTYTLVIQNSGNIPVVATDDAIVTDTFNPILNPISVTFNDASWTEGTNYTYNEATGAFATLPGQITVPAATYTQDETTGQITVTPGVAVIQITGTIQ